MSMDIVVGMRMIRQSDQSRVMYRVCCRHEIDTVVVIRILTI